MYIILSVSSSERNPFTQRARVMKMSKKVTKPENYVTSKTLRSGWIARLPSEASVSLRDGLRPRLSPNGRTSFYHANIVIKNNPWGSDCVTLFYQGLGLLVAIDSRGTRREKMGPEGIIELAQAQPKWKMLFPSVHLPPCCTISHSSQKSQPHLGNPRPP